MNPGEVKSGRTNLDRKDSEDAFELVPNLVEKSKVALPVNGLRLATGARRRGTGRVVRGKGKRGKAVRERTPSLPPRIELVSTVDCLRRFTCASNAASVSITRRTLFGSIGGIVTVANTTVGLFASSIRLRKITVWPQTASSTLWDVTVTGTAEQALVKDSVKNEALPTGVTLDHPVVWKPKRGSYLDLWQSFSDPSDQIFAVSMATGGVVDVHMQFTLCGAQQLAANTGTTSSTIALGLTGVFALDVSNTIRPLGYNTLLW